MTETRMDRMDRRDGALLRKVGDVIFAEPERYDQSTWVIRHKAAWLDRHCGTTACLAGHATALVHGFEGFCFRGASLLTLDAFRYGEVVDVEDTARDALGLTGWEATTVFGGGWLPAGEGPLHERVRDALYALADGATVEEVTA